MMQRPGARLLSSHQWHCRSQPVADPTGVVHHLTSRSPAGLRINIIAASSSSTCTYNYLHLHTLLQYLHLHILLLLACDGCYISAEHGHILHAYVADTHLC
jgi:hypothetical protein